MFVHSDVAGGMYSNFDYKSLIPRYLGITIFIFMLVGYKLFYKAEFRRLATMDLFTGKQEVDDEENEWLEK